MSDVHVRKLGQDEFDVALGIVARSMRANPLHVRALGDDPIKRGLGVRRLQGMLLASVRRRGVLLGTERDGALVGVLGMAKRKPAFTPRINGFLPLFYPAPNQSKLIYDCANPRSSCEGVWITTTRSTSQANQQPCK